jgi:hypothetical protein
MTPRIGTRRPPRPTLLAAGLGTAALYLAALVVLAVVVLALRAEVVGLVGGVR